MQLAQQLTVGAGDHTGPSPASTTMDKGNLQTLRGRLDALDAQLLSTESSLQTAAKSKTLSKIIQKAHKTLKQDLTSLPEHVGNTECEGFVLDNSIGSILKLEDIQIGRSVGAKAKNYEVMDLATGEKFKFVEGSRLQNIEVFAGKGARDVYRKAYKYANRYGGEIENWQHVKGCGWVETSEGDRLAEIHWSQYEGIGKYDFFVKRWLDE